MEMLLFVHGVPNGEDAWEINNVKEDFGSLYNNRLNDKIRFQIEVRQNFYYYRYLVYNGVQDRKGRLGSYFGMTLRFSQFCKDYMSLFCILDLVFNLYIKGRDRILDDSNKAILKYTISKFLEKGDYLKNVCKTMFDLLKGLRLESFCEQFSVINTGDICKCQNLYECNEADFLANIKQNVKMILSPYYPTSNELNKMQVCDEKVARMRKQCDAERQNSEQKYKQELERINLQCQQEIDKTKNNFEEQINNLKKSLEDRNNKLEKSQRIVSGIKKVFQDEDESFISDFPNSTREDDSRKYPKPHKLSNRWKGTLSYIIIAILMMIVAFVCMEFYK